MLYYREDTVEIHHGEALAILRELPDESVDVVLTDPPYSSGGAFRGDRTMGTVAKYVNSKYTEGKHEFSGDTRDQRGYLAWCSLWMSECLRVTKPGGLFLCFSDWRQLPITTDAIQAGGWVWRGIVPWDKTEATRPQRGRFSAQCEFVVWGTAGERTIEGRCARGIVRHGTTGGKRHIAEKPEAVISHLLQLTPAGGTVLDPFLGSGTTLRVAKDQGLRGIGIELLKHNCELARDRLKQGALLAQ